MSTIAFDQFALTRIADFARSLSRLHQASRRQVVDDDAIDREFNAVCMSVWGYTTDDFSDELFSEKDHAFLDSLDEAHARIFAAEQGYDLVDDNGMLTDWWGYCWMILAEKRGLLTPENRAAARAAIEEKYLAAVASWFETREVALLTMRGERRFNPLPPVSPVSKPSSAPRSRAARYRGLPQAAFHWRAFLQQPAPPSSRQAARGSRRSGLDTRLPA
jgi:hypothetical protein